MDALTYKTGRAQHDAVALLDGLADASFTGWLDPARRCFDSSGDQCEDGVKVADWQFREEAGFTASFAQGTDAARPTWRQGTRFPYVEFDGSDDFLRHVGTLFGVSATASLFMVAEFLGSSTTTPLCTADDAANDTVVWCLKDAGASPIVNVRFDNNQATDDLLTIVPATFAQRSAPILIHLRGDGTALTSKIFGVSVSIAAVTGANGASKMWGGVAGRDSWVLGALHGSGGASNFCNFRLYELMIVDTATSDTDILAKIYNYFQRKYRYKTVAHLGDDFADDGGYGIALRQALAPSWVAIQDHGVASETASQVATRWDSSVEGKGFNCLLLQAGSNDMKAASAGTADSSFVHIKRMIDEAVADSCRVVVCTVPPFGNNSAWSAVRQTETDRFNRLIRNYGAEKGVTVCDLYAFARNPDAAIRASVIGNAAGQNAAIVPAWEGSGGGSFSTAGKTPVAAFVAQHVFRALNYPNG